MYRLLLLILLVDINVSACPLVQNRFIDFNCDRNFKIVVAGDSIAYGLGDDANNNQGGYVTRLERGLGIEAINLGIAGATTESLLSYFRRNISKSSLKKQLRGADLVILDIGRNDYWNYREGRISMEGIVRNMKRIISLLGKKISQGKANQKPFFLTGTLIRVNRTNQNIFVGELNEFFLQAQSKSFPLYLRFDQNFSKSNLNPDNLHPTAAGYQQIYLYLKKFILRQLPDLMLPLREDLDLDGLYDIFETELGFDPSDSDTDDDGTLDGAEIFT